MGYSSESKGYRMLSLETLKILVSKDVIFDEEIKWNFSNMEEPVNSNASNATQTPPIIVITEISLEETLPPAAEINDSEDESDTNHVADMETTTSSSTSTSSSSSYSSNSQQNESSSSGESSSSPILRTRTVADILQNEDTNRRRDNINEMTLNTEVDPKHFTSAIKKEHWRKAMTEEF
jgi:hypothetical protein